MNHLISIKSSGSSRDVFILNVNVTIIIITIVLIIITTTVASSMPSHTTAATLATPATAATTPGDYFVFRNSSGGRFKHSTTSRIVNTQYGRLKGMVMSIDLPNPQRTERVEAFLGIQYASSLGGELRFMPPTGPMEKWEGIKVVNKFRPVCPQHIPNLEDLKEKVSPLELERLKLLRPFVLEQQEDCLNMNIYVPRRDDEEVHVRLPVLLFIHGDSFHFGTGNAYEGGVMAASGGLVLVTFNYRLGIFGFLSTGDSHAPGNYAILDIVAALHFIRKNIESFGGDPTQVTLMGQDHSAALINYLLISPVTKGKNLFKKVIMSGASALSSWALDKNPLVKTIPLAYQLNCTQSPAVRLLDTQETKDLVTCLKKTSLENLLKVQLHTTWFVPSFGPVIDQSTLSAKNLELLDSSLSIASFSDAPGATDTDVKHSWNVVNISSGDVGKLWKNFRFDSIGQPGTSRGQIKADKSLMDRRRLQSAALIFDNIPLIVGLPSSDSCSFNFPRSMYDLFHVYSNRSALIGTSNFQDRQHSIPQIFFPTKLKTNASSSANNSRTPVLTSKIVRYLRTFTQNLFSYHRQKIYDVLLYHYRNLESRSKSGNDIDSINNNNNINNDNISDDDEVGKESDSDTFNVEQLLVDGLYLSPLLRMLKARVSPSSAQQNPVWVYNLEDQPPNSGNWFSGSDYYDEQSGQTQQSKSCFNYKTLVSNVIRADLRGDSRSDEGREGDAQEVEGEDGRLLRAVLDLHLTYSIGLETTHESRRQTSTHRNGRRFWMEKLINFIHTGFVVLFYDDVNLLCQRVRKVRLIILEVCNERYKWYEWCNWCGIIGAYGLVYMRIL